MSSEKLIEDWNAMFASFKISSHDLDSPTEAFLTTALINILNSINVDVSRSVADPDPESQRLAKIKLFQYINYMYRTLNKKKFLFFDLINPTPKKTLNLLQTLLNYVLYYNMVKDEVVSSTKAPMVQFRELTEKKQQCIKDNEHNKNLAKQMQAATESFANEVAELTKIVDDLESSSILAQYEKNVELKTAHKMMLGQLTVDINELRVQCVQEDEYEKMKSSVFEAQESLSEINETAEKLAEGHQNLCDDMVNMQERIGVLESLNGMVYAGKLVKASEIVDLQDEVLQQSNEVERNGQVILELKEQLDQLQRRLNGAVHERDAAKDTFSTNCDPLICEIEEKLEKRIAWEECVEEANAAEETAEWELDLMTRNADLALEMIKKSHLVNQPDDS